MNQQQFTKSPQPFQAVSYIQQPGMIQQYAFNQPNYAIPTNEYYSTSNAYQPQQFYQQPQYIQPTNPHSEYQNLQQVTYSSEPPIDQKMQNSPYLKTLSLTPLAQQHLPPKLKMRQPVPTQSRSPAIPQQPQPIQIQQPIQQPQIISPQYKMQPQAYIQVPTQIVQQQIQIQPQMMTDYSQQQTPQYQSQQQAYQPQLQQKSYKSSVYYTDNEPPVAFDIIGRGNLPSVYFTYDNS